MELCSYKSEGVARSWLRLSSHLGVQTTWRHLQWQAAVQLVWGNGQGFREGLRASPGQPDSSLICWTLAPHWCGRTLVLAVSHCLGPFKKNKLLLEGDCENRGVLRAHLKRNQSFSVSFYEKVTMGFFSPPLFLGMAAYEVRGRESIKGRQHWKQDFLKRPSQCGPCAVIWSVLTELSRGMEKIIRRNVWGALKRSRPRDWPMGERPAERLANFFLMNSTACSTM